MCHLFCNKEDRPSTEMNGERMEGSSHVSRLHQVNEELLVPGVSTDKVRDYYNQWANQGYDEHLLANDGAHYGALPVLRRTMEELFPCDRQSATVLDVGAGTGITGQLMKDLGFGTVDALDPAEEMLRVAQEKNIYRHHYLHFLTQDPLPDMDADSYDAIVLAGVVGHGHLPPGAFQEMARLVKPGGYIVNCMRAAYLQEVPDYIQNWEPLVKRLEDEGKWRVVKMEPYPNHYIGKQGLLMVFRGC